MKLILVLVKTGKRLGKIKSLMGDHSFSSLAGVCPQCGEKIVKADVGRWIISLLNNSERIARAPRITVPTIKFDVEETIVT